MTPEQAILYQQQHEVSFYQEVKPILDSRCVACHGCYDAPCQLKLGSIKGLDRGATKQLVYDSTRLKAADPARLFIDATDTEGWRKKGFYPVLNERIENKAANLDICNFKMILKRQTDWISSVIMLLALMVSTNAQATSDF